MLRTLFLFTIASLLVIGASTAEAGKAKKAKKAKKSGAVAGIVEAIEQGKEKDSGTITVKVGAKKKKGAPAPAGETKKFELNKDTKFETVSGKKGAKETKSASFSDLKQGGRVAVVSKDGKTAEKVDILAKGKKKKKNT